MYSSKNDRKMIEDNLTEARLFIFHVLELFPAVEVSEMRRLLANYTSIFCANGKLERIMNELKVNGFFEEEDGKPKLTEQTKELIKQSADAISAKAIKGISEIVGNSQMLVKKLKASMMENLDIRLESEPDSFSNDELIRGAKSMHEIENNTDNKPPDININFNIDEFNQVYDNLKNRKSILESGGAGDLGADGEV